MLPIFYKKLSYPDNPNAEYQRRKGVWYKRKKGSNEQWYRVQDDQVKWLNSYYEKKGKMYFFNDTFIIGAVIGLGLGYYIYLKRGGFGVKKSKGFGKRK